MSGRRALGALVMTFLAGAPAPAGAAAAPLGRAVYGPCGGGPGTGARCGTVAVRLDRAHPSAGTIPIAFRLYPHTEASRPAVSTVVYSTGGPGLSNTLLISFWQGRLKPLLATHDLLAIDHRGTGRSAAIDCPGLQHVTGDQVAAARRCGARLGAAADRYGSGDVAADVEAVRRALHLGRIDYYGVSYGAVDVRAYAYRYPSHLRSAILDSPDYSDDEAFSRTLPGAMARIAALVCDRSPACSAVNRKPAPILTGLARRLRRAPVQGTSYDADGRAHRQRVGESALLGILYNDYFADPAFLNQGEIFAAANALAHGDATPLLRLAAESPRPSDFGDPSGLQSVGADYAVFCSDSRFPWSKDASAATREAQYRRALRALPGNATAPFSARAWTGFIASQPVLLIPGADACVPWPRPRRPTPPFPRHQRFPANVPALLLGGGLDYLDVSEERTLLPLFRKGTFVTVADAGHVTTFWNACAQAIAVRFLRTLHTGSTRCAADTKGAMVNPFGSATGTVQLQGLGRFPARAADAVPATVDHRYADRSTLAERRVAGVAWAAAEDAVYRLPRMTGTAGRGLRGGTYTITKAATSVGIDFHGVRFSRDVAIAGHARYDTAAHTLSGTLAVAGPGSLGGTVTVRGVLWDPRRPHASLRGTLDGRAIALLAPAR